MDKWSLAGFITTIPKGLLLKSETTKLLKINDITKPVLDAIQNGPFWAKYLFKDEELSYYLLEHFNKNYYVQWDVNIEDIKVLDNIQTSLPVGSREDNEKELTDIIDVKALFASCKEKTKELSPDAETFKLQMMPPDIGTSSTNSNNQIPDPRSYLENKYYEGLFLIHIPLAYFVKSNLVRFKNMCKAAFKDDYQKEYRKILSDMTLEVTNFDKHHDGTTFLINDNISTEKQFFLQHRDACLRKYSINKSIEAQKEFLTDLAFILKLREIKLQIIFLLELIYLNKLDNNFKNFEKKYKAKLKKRSLNIARKSIIRSKRQENKKIQHTKPNSFNYLECLDLYLDKLNILEVILETEASEPESDELPPIKEQKKSILDKNKESSSIGFTNYVLIPYFSKKAPNAVEFIASKLRGPSLRSKKPTFTKAVKDYIVDPYDIPTGSQTQVASRRSSLTSSIDNSVPSSPQMRIPRPAFVRQSTLGSHLPDLLNSRTDSNLSEFLASDSQTIRKPSLLSRTKSDILMNNLQKRQLSVKELESSASRKISVNRKLATGIDVKSLSVMAGGNISSPQNQQSFKRVGRRKAIKTFSAIEHLQQNRPQKEEQTDLDPFEIQVMATPKVKRDEKRPNKRAALHRIVESPINNSMLIKTPADKPKLSPLNTNLSMQAPQIQGSTVESPPKKKTRRRLFAP
ncbi:Sld3p NDAI_0I01470 [Naumovozyma dairenensis CBS 421]|uniref:DNA replication regulator Sld3 C-terminal domain-containing protein n=1 Tax=Naumovozyma dairenensis (strain ATCC 10597 / BCRC 20456 / CBS 421 / NBRC 0211 / NRRL Y-12639) TaxID=1071378 RepID=G0WG05_NAUDC|nr:hypothetical protein NDAI_0I01470 [Naumovozyma dairenensis CBS 421]CCD26716.1 hypothetical protein NDAI_0I01470 [Naumovozyma dairenensis CBS 421]